MNPKVLMPFAINRLVMRHQAGAENVRTAGAVSTCPLPSESQAYSSMISRHKLQRVALCAAAILLTVFALRADTSFEKFNSSVPLDGEVFIMVNVSSGRCLSVSGESQNRGANIVQGPRAADAGRAERWRVFRAGDHYYKLVNVVSGKVLSVPESSRKSGTQMIQWDDAASVDQKWKEWKFVKIGNHYALKSRVNGLVPDVQDGSVESGASVIQWPWKTEGNANHIWFVQWVPGLGRATE